MRLVSMVLSVFVCVTVSACSTAVSHSLIPGSPAPMTRYSTLDGTRHTLDESRGMFRVLLFWATTCSKSKRLVEKVNDFAREFSLRGDIAVIALSGDTDPTALEEFIGAKKLDALTHGCSFNAEYDEAFLDYGVREIPLLVLIDPDGVIRYAGSDLDDLRDALAGRS